MRSRRTVLGVAALAAVMAAVAHPWAGASSDLYGNVGPGGSLSGLADRYPLGHYALDQHFSAVKASITGGIDASGVPSMIAFFLADLVWQITAFVANALITLFSFAFSLDLLNGSEATGGAGALAPVSDAIARLYAHTFGQPWMVIAVTLAGCWAMWHALVQRRYTETAGALGMSLVFCLIALAIVTRPDQTIGQASRLTNQLSIAFLAVTAHGQVTGGDQARRAAADQLFGLLIYTPWVALNFGGTEHCIRNGTGSADHDPESVPVRPLGGDPATDARLRRRLRAQGQVTTPEKACVDNTVRYPEHFLRYAAGSEDRDAEYDALNDADAAKLPDSDPAKGAGSYRPGVVDKPVTDAMEKGGQSQRLLLALVIVVGELGALLLLGGLSVSVLLAQVVVLLLACFAPVALVAGIIPGRGHHAFKAWGALLGSYLVRKAAYSLVLAVILAVLSALQDATSNLGWLLSFALQALLLWTVYLQRHTLAGQLTSTLTGHHPHADAQLRRLLRLRSLRQAIPHARRPHHNPTPPSPRSGNPTVPLVDQPSQPTPPAPPAAADLGRASLADLGVPAVNRDRQPRRPARGARVQERSDQLGTHQRSRPRADAPKQGPRSRAEAAATRDHRTPGTTAATGTPTRPQTPSPPSSIDAAQAEHRPPTTNETPAAGPPAGAPTDSEPPTRQRDDHGTERSLAEELRDDRQRLHDARPDRSPGADSPDAPGQPDRSHHERGRP